MMEAKLKIISSMTIKPSSTIPHHLKDFKLSYLDQMSPYQYIPALLFYPANEVNGYNNGFTSICEKLKASLSEVLSLYYPLCGKIKENAFVDYNDMGVPFIEASVSHNLDDIIKCPQVNVLKELLPVDLDKPSDVGLVMAVQVNKLSCGSIALGVCISHKIADGVVLASFLNAWVKKARGIDSTIEPFMEASLLFPTREDMSVPYLSNSDINKENFATMRLVFDRTSLSRLRDEMNGYNPTRVEAVTALIWKTMIEASIANSKGENFVRWFATHAVNIRNHMVPLIPEQSIGNFVHLAITPLVEFQVNQRIVELQDLAVMVRKAIMGFDGDYVSKFASDVGFDITRDYGNEIMSRVTLKGAHFCTFSSWTKFKFYEADFGWGKPSWASTINFATRNMVTLMPTRSDGGIEAWVNLDEQDVVKFESNPKLLEFALLVSRASSI